MENIKIYRNGKYDVKANLKLKAQQKLPIIISKVDSFFVKY